MSTDSGDPGHQGGRVVPVYALTHGRTRSSGEEMPIEALVTATALAARNSSGLQVEYRTIIELGAQPISVMEIGAALKVPVGVARVLVSDLANAGYLVVHLPPSTTEEQAGPSHQVLERLLDGLRAR